MTVITFYSYKGGVGRSMALANVALVLAQRGKRVLVVDWDLEAPGIERFFADLRIAPEEPGLLPMLREISLGRQPDYHRYCWRLTSVDGSFGLTLLHSGRETDAHYYKHLEEFSWSQFFKAGGGDFLEDLRERWLVDFDFVLIDSRTGLSDAGGVCTIQLPDVVVALFTASRQSLFGVRDVMRLARSARQRLAFDRTELSVVPVPTRGDPSQASYGEWLARFADETKEFFADWLPRDADIRHVLEQLALPHDPAALHGENVAVLREGSAHTRYHSLATLLASDLGDLSAMVPLPTPPDLRDRRADAFRGGFRSAARDTPTDYDHDIFISYPHTELISRWLEETFLPELQDELELLLGERPKIWLDRSEIQGGDMWQQTLHRALLTSRFMLCIWTPVYFQSPMCLAELETFRRRSERFGSPLFLPILFAGREQIPRFAQGYAWLDLTSHAAMGRRSKSSQQYREFQELVGRLARTVVERLRQVPVFDPHAPVADPDEMQPAAVPAFPPFKDR